MSDLIVAMENFVPLNQQQRESKVVIEAEIERLTSDLMNKNRMIDVANAHNTRLQAENERLRAALEKYADQEWWPEQLHHHSYLRKLAKAALEQDHE